MKNSNIPLTKFSLADFLNRKIFISIDSGVQHTTANIEIDAIDGQGTISSNSLIIRITANPIEIHMTSNTGLKLSHKSFVPITSQNLSFSTNNLNDEMNIPLIYVIIDQPEFGIVECAKIGIDGFQLCSRFTQQDLDDLKVRYKHTSENRPMSDVFTFKVGVFLGW
uniref:Uncharacterized protein n=1 Tax=Panagrolaimus sp. JU765 TaxID=591449 RepID=A0AC34RB97_9BILA